MTSVLPASADASRPQEPTTPAGDVHPEPPDGTADPRWARPALIGLLAATGLLYLWGLGSNGWSNSYYAAAAQAGTQSWKAFLFGSFDAGNFITVDKPPAFLWLMELSGRVFGFTTWSMLVPQAVCGVLSVALLHATVRRWYPAPAALLAGAVLAVTPIATLMFRYNNPDALLVLLLIAAAYAVTRAVERASVGWLVLAGVAMGFGYLTKMLQALLLLPALALTYLIVAPTGLRTRLWHLLAAGGAMIVSAGWWIAIVELTPAGSRPYVGGSPSNDILELTFGYNGIGRLTGGDGNRGPGFGGKAGFARMFSESFGGQASWLLPAALLAVVVLLWSSGRAPRTDRTRAAAIIWGGWLLVTAGVFSFMTGTIHEYYTVAFAPAVAALVGIAVPALWRERDRWLPRVTLAAMLGGTAGWSFVLLDRTPDFAPWLRFAVLGAGAVAAIPALVPPRMLVRTGAPRLRRPTLGAVLLTAAFALFAGPFAYSIQTATAAGHSGGIITAGPATATGLGGFRGRPFPGAGAPGGGFPGAGFPGGGFPGGGFPGGGAPGGGAPGGGAPGGGAPGGGAPGGGAPGGGAPGGAPDGGTASSGFPGGGARGAGQLGRGGGFGRGSADAAVVAMLKASPDRYRWAAAAISANGSADLEIASGKPIMAIGGFTGSDPAPTLAQFKEWVAAGKVHFFIGPSRAFPGGGVPGGGIPGGGIPGGQARPGGPGGANAPRAVATFGEISNWVAASYPESTVGAVTVYDLSTPAAG